MGMKSTIKNYIIPIFLICVLLLSSVAALADRFLLQKNEESYITEENGEALYVGNEAKYVLYDPQEELEEQGNYAVNESESSNSNHLEDIISIISQYSD